MAAVAAQRFLWAAKLLFVPRFFCVLISCTAHSDKKRDYSWHCSCAKGYEKSPSDTMEPERGGGWGEGGWGERNPIKLSGAPEREDVKPRLFSFTLELPLPLSLSFSATLLPWSSVFWRGNDLGWGRGGRKVGSILNETYSWGAVFEAGSEDL